MQPRNQGLCGSLRLLSSLARRRPHDAVESRFSNAVHVRASTVTWCVYALRVWRVLRLSQNERAGQYRTLTSHAQRRLWTPPLSLRVVVVLAFAFRIRPGTRRRRFSRWLCEPSGAKFSVMRRDTIYKPEGLPGFSLSDRDFSSRARAPRSRDGIIRDQNPVAAATGTTRHP